MLAYGRRSFSKYGIFTTMFTTADVNIHALIAKYGIDIISNSYNEMLEA
jgi:hypothetical protein